MRVRWKSGCAMRHLFMVLLMAVSLSGCGVVLPYLHDAETLDKHLAVSMSRADVLKQLGKPYAVVLENEHQAIWEYRLYADRQWLGYLIHCPFFPNCYMPAEPAVPYYVAFRNDELCLWGTPRVVRTLIRKACLSESATERSPFDGSARNGGLQVSTVPVFMPPPIVPLPTRLAILPIRRDADDRLVSWLDLTLNFLRSRHPSLVLVEREDLQAVFDELITQYSGRVDEETAARVGRLTGADSLLLYRLSIVETGLAVSASFELRMVRIENGTNLFRQIATATAGIPPGSEGSFAFKTFARQSAVEQAAAYGLASLAAAFGDNPLGIVPDHSWSDKGVKLIGLLEGGPASRSGLKPGDRIMAADGMPFEYWAERIAAPAALTIERDRATLNLAVVLHHESLKAKEIRNN